MREFCLLDSGGNVVNMCLTAKPEPYITEFQASRGYRWVPLSQVSQAQLTRYRYWNERP